MPRGHEGERIHTKTSMKTQTPQAQAKIPQGENTKVYDTPDTPMSEIVLFYNTEHASCNASTIHR